MSGLSILIWIICITVFVAGCFTLTAYLTPPPPKKTYAKKAVVSAAVSSSSSATTASTATSTSATPSVTPAVRNYIWLWWIVLIPVAIIAYHFIAPALRTTTAPAPQATAPKKELKKQLVKIPLEFVGGEKFVREPGRVEIRKGGHANFRARLPILPNGKYKIHYHGQRATEGQDHLEINRGKENAGRPFDITHRATDLPVKIIFFDEEYGPGFLSGEAKYFRSGENYFKLWADDDLLVQLDKPHYVEITYWE